MWGHPPNNRIFARHLPSFLVQGEDNKGISRTNNLAGRHPIQNWCPASTIPTILRWMPRSLTQF